MAAFACITFGLFEQTSAKIVRATKRLEAKIEGLEGEIHLAREEQTALKLQVGSQSDPAWIALALIKGLGLIPEGYTKIYFEEEP